MTASQSNEDRYSTPGYIATYLHAEWGDLIYPAEEATLLAPALMHGNSAAGGPGHFYKTTAALTRAWASESSIECRRIGDVGGGTGRMCLELAREFPGAQEVMLVEPSAQFCVWSRRFLLGDVTFDRWIPVPADLESPGYTRVPAVNLPPVTPHISIHNCSAEDTPRPPGYFDLITCLNVVDRVPDPVGMVRTLGQLLRPGGFFVLASPLHFEESFTKREAWFTDLKELFSTDTWCDDLREADVKYTFLHYRRRLNCYLTQVIGAQKRVQTSTD